MLRPNARGLNRPRGAGLADGRRRVRQPAGRGSVRSEGEALGSTGAPGSSDADGALMRAFHERRQSLLLFLAARSGSMASAEDLVQELYLKVAELGPTAEARSPSALLYKMAGNLLVDHVRSAQRASRREAQWRLDNREILGGEDVLGGPSAEEAMVQQERARQLAEAVAALPPQMGRAFRLHKLQGLSQAETAQAMGVSRKMVEHHIHAALKQLTQRLRS